MKEDDWIKVANANELAGNGYKDNYPMQVDEVLENSVRAWGCEWFTHEYTECNSPLFYRQHDSVLNADGIIAATFNPQFIHLIPQVLEQLNEEYY